MTARFDLVIRSTAVYTPGGVVSAAVAVTDGVIRAIEAFDAPLDAVVDRVLSTGQVLIPGIVDTHVHVNEPGRTEWEGFETATRAAAAGGVTTIIDMPLNSIPPTTTVEALDLKRAAAEAQVTVDVGFWGGAIPANLGSLRSLHDRGVFGFKAFLSPSGVDEFPALSTAQLFEAAAEIASFGGLLIVHAEDPGVLEQHASSAVGAQFAAFVETRPEAAEQTAIATVIDAVRRTGVRAHILHLSSASALGELRLAKSEGLPITVETCPHYLVFTADQVPDGATEFKCCPPIRDKANQDLLWAALLDGTIDFIASDHSPSTRELKRAHGSDFGEAWGGISGIQVSLPGVWSGARARGISLDKVIQWMSQSTAHFAGLAAKGKIEPAARADLVAFSPETSFVVSAAELRHKNPLSAFDGATLFGRVETTWLAGKPVFDLADDRVSENAGSLLTARALQESRTGR